MASSRTARRARPAWADARFLIGIALVVASVAGVWWVVQQARATAPALAAAAAIAPGQIITAADVVEVDAQLGTATERYLAPRDLDDGLIATRAVAEGELVAVSATGEPGAVDRTTVVVESALDVPAGIAEGAVVELWAAPLEAPSVYGEPIVLVDEAVVSGLQSDEGLVGDQGTRLELVVERAQVAAVLQHVASGSALSAVPVAVVGGAS